MKLIEIPAWAFAFNQTVDDDFGEEEFQKVQNVRGEILSTIKNAIQGYIEDDSLAFNLESDGFPARERLSREYYIGSENYWVNDEPWFQNVGRKREYRFSFEIRCLEHLRDEEQKDQDYLGLEVHFDWDPNSGTFTFHGDIDSSVI